MIKYTDQRNEFLNFNTVEELKNYIVNKYSNLVKKETITFGEIPSKNNSWQGWKYVYVLINSPWDGKPHKQIMGIAELGENYEG